KIVTDEDQARVVRRIFDRYLAGDGHRTIAVRLTREKIPTPSKAKNRKNSAREWSSAMVRLILESEVYAGRGQWNGTEIPAPAIVDEETFASVQAERAKRSRYPSGNSSADNILTGVLYCSECGSRMQGDRTTVRK